MRPNRLAASLAGMLALAIFLQMAYAQQWPTQAWPVSTPDKLGLDTSMLSQLDADIAAGKYGNTDGLLIVRHGQIAFDRAYPHDYDKIYAEQAKTASALNPHDFGGPYNYFNPWWHPYYRRGELHSLQSVTKTITSITIGAALARGEFPSIDTPVLKYFPGGTVANVDERKRRMTVRHLLTMTAGLDWNESLPYSDPKNTGTLMEAGSNWVQYTIDRPMSDEPGARFNYNSGATMLLAHIFRQATGQDLEEYAAKRVFAPLGIVSYFWKRAPEGLPDAEGGLYLDRHDLAKIAYLYLKNGAWDGKQVVSAAWVKESLTRAIAVSRSGQKQGSGVQYGFKWWLYPYGKDDPRLAFGGSGFGGQVPLAIPGYDLVLVVNAWNVSRERGLGAAEAMTRVLAAVKDR